MNKVARISCILILFIALIAAASSVFPASAETVSPGADTVTISIANADIREVLSAIALESGYSIIYIGDPVEIKNFNVSGISADEALLMAIRMADLEYLQDGNTIIVGNKELLSTAFFDSIALTKFSLKYVDAYTISSQIDVLGIPVQKITLDSNPNAIWIQGLPRELGKCRELISLLDIPENTTQDAGKPTKLTAINLTYLTAYQMNDILRSLGLPTGLVLDSNPKILYVYTNNAQSEMIQELKAKLDIPANQQGAGFTVSMKKLTYVRADQIVPIIYQFGLGVEVITLDRSAMAVWLAGDEGAIKQVSALIDQIDIKQNIDANHFIIRKLKNISALEAEYRLSLLDIPGIKTYTFSYPQFSKSIFVVCPEDYKMFVIDHLNQLDVPSDKIKVPIDFSDDTSGSYRLEQRRKLLASLTGIPESSFTISQNVSRDGDPYYVLILEETPEKIRLAEDMIKKIDNPLGNQYQPY